MSRTARFITIVAVFAIFVTALSAFAADAVTLSTGEKNINARSGPGLEYVVRAVLRAETILTVTGRNDFDVNRVCRGQESDNDMWLRVQYRSMEGWVARCAVTVEGDLASVAVVEPANPQMAAAEPLKKLTAPEELDTSKYIGHTGENVVLRQSASLNAAALGVIPANKPVYVIGRTENGAWVKVQFGEHSGWVARHLMVLGYDWQDKTPVQ